jgi:hypothetical protein
MSNSDYAINHCGITAEIQDSMSTPDFQEQVMDRVGEKLSTLQGGEEKPASKYAAVELVANVIATKVAEQGAKEVTSDLGLDLDRMIYHAKSEHISGC